MGDFWLFFNQLLIATLLTTGSSMRGRVSVWGSAWGNREVGEDGGVNTGDGIPIVGVSVHRNHRILVPKSNVRPYRPAESAHARAREREMSTCMMSMVMGQRYSFGISSLAAVTDALAALACERMPRVH